MAIIHIELSENERALCITALEYGATDLREAHAASVRLGVPTSVDLLAIAAEMEALRERLLPPP